MMNHGGHGEHGGVVYRPGGLFERVFVGLGLRAAQTANSCAASLTSVFSVVQ
jgi:hypothetical protein